MAFNKRESALIERYKKSGRTINRERLDAAFHFLVRPLATIGADTGKYALWFEDEVVAAIKGTKFGSPVSCIMISPIVIDETMSARPPDSLRFKRSENAVYVAIGIDYAAWNRSSDVSKLGMTYENIKQSLSKISTKHLLQDDRDRLFGVVDNVYVKFQSRLVH